MVGIWNEAAGGLVPESAPGARLTGICCSISRTATTIHGNFPGWNPKSAEVRISKVSFATWRMFDRLSRTTEYGRVVSPGNGSR
jgi:hypothetical protein